MRAPLALLAAAASLHASLAFAPASARAGAASWRSGPPRLAALPRERSGGFDPVSADLPKAEAGDAGSNVATLLSPAFMLAAMTPTAALAKEGAYGIFEGRTFSIIHPISMFAMFAASLYAGFLGWQWRRTRTIGGSISELKEQLPVLSTGKVKSYSDQLAALQTELTALQGQEDLDAVEKKAVVEKDLATLKGASDVAAQIDALTATRKNLVSGNYKDKHFAWSCGILAVGVSSAIVGPINTFMRAGKLFPGPHLFAGAAMVSIWAVAAALVPQMQKGSEPARVAHIGLNAVNVGLFAWQVNTGFEILLKVLKFTKWP